MNDRVKLFKNVILRPFERDHKGYFLGRMGAHTEDGERIYEAMYFTTPENINCVDFLDFDDSYEDYIAEPCIYAGFSNGAYGHFITEGIARLWRTQDCPWPIVFMDQRVHPGLYAQILRFLGVKGRVINLAKPTKFAALAFPDPACQIHSYIERRQLDFLARQENAIIPGKKIFFSRSKLHRFMGGHTQDDARFDEIFAKRGFKVVYPETLTFMEQVEEVATSELVTGLEASYFHTLLFLKDPVKTRFVAFARHMRGEGMFNIIKNQKNVDYKTIKIRESNKKVSSKKPIPVNFEYIETLLDRDPDLKNIDALNIEVSPDLPPVSFADNIKNFKETTLSSKDKKASSPERPTLDYLARKFGTNKHIHEYFDLYEQIFEPLRDKYFCLLELGIYKGQSLNMWREFFPKALIVGVDITDKDFGPIHPEIRVELITGDDRRRLANIIKEYNPTIVIDDASHTWADQINSFITVFRLLEPGAYYLIEAIHTSFGTFRSRKRPYANYPVDPARFFSQISLAVMGDSQTQFYPGLEDFSDEQVRAAGMINYMIFKKHLCLIAKKH
ncbi:MAG: glycosyltransferase 61 family protein [Desulfovibrio sp.]|nr:glycosyltransferase 61 family protein [Desulfovibrio sp.]